MSSRTPPRRLSLVIGAAVGLALALPAALFLKPASFRLAALGAIVVLLAILAVAEELAHDKRRSRAHGLVDGLACFEGRQATVLTPLAPIGQVRVDGEVWRARLESGSAAQPGESVVVVSAGGLQLVVRSCKEDPCETVNVPGT